jgi:hypothetical protein
MNPAEQLNLADYAREVEAEQQEVVEATRKNRKSRAYIVFATDPAKVGQDDYKLVFACKARTSNEAENKVQAKLKDERRILAYLASGKYRAQLPEARWID